jgi:hypothetical protein
MFRCLNVKTNRGFTLIEVLLGAFLTLIVFLGIFFAYQLTLKVIGTNRNKVTATAIAKGELEKIKNLPYQSVGVIGGFPDGVLDASRTDTINNINYTVEDRVDYVIDPRDGIASPDDECPNDYKRVEVKVSWSGLFSGQIKLDTDVSPKNLAQECSETGGILSISVFDAFGVMVSSPLIEVKDPQTGQVVKTATPISGKHYFSLAPATYKVVVSKDGYSSEQTYGVEQVANPEKPNPIVLEGQVSEISFSIDKVSSFSIDTLSPWGTDYFSDSFLDQSKVSKFSDLAIGSGEVVLTDSGGVYKTSGYLISTSIEPTDLIGWQDFSFNDSQPQNTQILYHVLYYDGLDWILVPDSDLPGNSTGFETYPIDLSGLDTDNYPKLELKANFSTTDLSNTPVLYDWQLSWKTNQATPAPNVSFDLQGAKIIGTDTEEQPVYKFSQSFVSDSRGHIDIADLEWDSYIFSIDPATGLDLEATDPSPQPISLPPDTSSSVSLYVNAQNSLLVTVQDVDTGLPIFAANVRLYKSDLSYDKTQQTDEKGQTYFIPLDVGAYTIEAQISGYQTKSESVSVSGDGSIVISLTRTE